MNPPKFEMGQPVIVARRPAFINDIYWRKCGAHPGEWSYGVIFAPGGPGYTPWPYCESQITSREESRVG